MSDKDDIDASIDRQIDKIMEEDVLDKAPDDGNVGKGPDEKEERFKTSDMPGKTDVIGGPEEQSPDNPEKPNPLAQILAGVTHMVQNFGEDLDIDEEDVEAIESYSQLFKSISGVFEKLEEKKKEDEFSL